MPLLGWLLVAVAKGSVLLLLLLLVSRASVWSAAQRHALLTVAVLAQVWVLVFGVILPPVRVPVPVAFQTAAPSSWSGAFNLPAKSEHSGHLVRSSTETSVDLTDLPAPAHSIIPDNTPGGRASGVRVRVGVGGRVAAAAVFLWVLVSALLLARLARSIARARTWVSRGRPLLDPGWEQDLRWARDRLNLGQRVRLLTKGNLAVPVSLSAGQPTVVLPPDAASWTAARRRAVLLHELAHLKRRDPQTQSLCLAVCALLWPNPLVWVASRALREEAERACDDAVVEAGLRPSTYVLELVAIARRLASGGAATSTALTGNTSLEGRTRSLLSPGLRRTPLSRRAAVSVGVAAVGFAAVFAAFHPTVGASAVPAAPTVVSGAATTAASNLVSDSAAPAAVRTAVDPPARASALPATITVASGAAVPCPYNGGALRNRFLPTADGKTTWEVFWEGNGCHVRVETRGGGPGDPLASLRLEGPLGVRLEPRIAGASVTIAVVRGDETTELRVARDDNGGIRRERRVGGELQSSDATAESALGAWTLAVDRVTGFAAAVRIPSLLASGGSEAVFAEVGALQGDHAAGKYLGALLETRRLDDRQLQRLLHMAADRVSNEAVLEGLLQRVARSYDLDTSASRAAFDSAFEKLRTRAGRESVAALRRG